MAGEGIDIKRDKSANELSRDAVEDIAFEVQAVALQRNANVASGITKVEGHGDRIFHWFCTVLALPLLFHYLQRSPS